MNIDKAEVIEKGHKTHIGGDEHDLSDLDKSLLKNKINEKLKKKNYTGFSNVSADVDDSIGCEHVNIFENAQSFNTDFNDSTQCVSISFIDHSPSNYRDLEDMV